LSIEIQAKDSQLISKLNGLNYDIYSDEEIKN